MRNDDSGFTLVELSIVLVILGLLIGGVLTGQSLIRAAELRSLTSQFQRYQSAVYTFRDKYMGIPGDMTNAQAYWGIAHATPATCASTVGTGTQTCNGDGDGRIAPPTVPAAAYEFFRAWQHLANAGLIEGSYNGVGGTNGYTQTVANTPAGKIGTSLWTIQTYGSVGGNPGGFDGEYGTLLTVGGVRPNDTAALGILKPEEVYNIDIKMDDGMPATGKIVVGALAGLNLCTNTSSNTNYAATYLLTNAASNCTVVFRQLF